MHNDTKIAVLFIIINFCVAYVSDNVLNDLSKYSKIKAFTSLSPYFKKKSIVGAGIYAGLTVAAATIILMILYNIGLCFACIFNCSNASPEYDLRSNKSE